MADERRRELLAEFDRGEGFYKAAADISRTAEDAYLEASAAPILREESKRQRRWVILTAVATVLAAGFDIKPTNVAALDLDLSGAKEQIVIWGAGLFLFYFLVEFIAFARRDYLLWRRRVTVTHRRLLNAFNNEKAQIPASYQISSRTQDLLKEVEVRAKQYQAETSTKADERWILALAKTAYGWVEFFIPILIAIAAILTWLWRLTA